MPEPDFRLSCSGKTFLLGEYYITQHGQAFLVNTAPRFSLDVTRIDVARMQRSGIRESGIRESSPAGKFVSAHFDVFKNYKLSFTDPYHGLGGLGASTGEFLLIHQAYLKLNKQKFDKRTLLESYLSHAWNQKGTPPSAADLFSQMTGGVTYVNRDSLEIAGHAWPFPELEFHLIHTRNKLATHEHLTQIETIKIDCFEEIFNSALAAFKSNAAYLFCSAINNYQAELERQNLSDQYSRELIKKFRNKCSIAAAKGCGAMGSDIILLLSKCEETENIKSLCEELKLIYIACRQNLTDGMNSEETVVS
jgi:mevalonate kinase